MKSIVLISFLTLAAALPRMAQEAKHLQPFRAAADLNIGEAQKVTLRDGSAPAVTSSNPEGEHAEDGYAVIVHRFAKPGHYIVKVTRSNEAGPATTHVEVVVGK